MVRNALIILALSSLILISCSPPEVEYSQQGLNYAKSGNNQKALEYFNKAIEINPYDADFFNNRGNVYYALKQYGQAKGDYSKAIQLAPEYYLPHSNLGNVYDDLGQPEKAIEQYSKAIKLKPDEPLPYRNRGVTLMRMRKFDLALSDLNRAIELNPNYAFAYSSRIVVHAALKQFDEAAQDLAHIKEIDPKLASQTSLVGTLKKVKVAPDLSIDKSVFGIWKSNGKSGRSFIKTLMVPLVEDQSYGWLLRLNTNRKLVKVREELHLPHAPVTWGDSESTNISSDQQLAISEKEMKPDKNGIIGHFWKVAKGDPEGPYIINVYIENELVETFIFLVKK